MKESWKIIGGVLAVTMTGLLAVGGFSAHSQEQDRLLAADHAAAEKEKDREHAFEKAIMKELHADEKVIIAQGERIKALEALVACGLPGK